jgi:CxC2 like cysteine cluster associated with KDZ transposases
VICPCPERGPQQFTVFALTGIHHINIDYCGCKDLPLSKTVQILRQGWFPATFNRPQTAFTFDCLGFFHELTLQGKVNLYDFYHTLLRVTDNANLSKTVVSYFHLLERIRTQYFQYRYTEFHRVFRMWRNLMALKRAGRGQDPLGVEGTAQGELAVECPACPHPGRNLPDNWREAGNMLYVNKQLILKLNDTNYTFRFLYILYIAVDANFKLKGKERGLKDVELMPGWAYFVREAEFQAHIANYIDQPEVFFLVMAQNLKL